MKFTVGDVVVFVNATTEYNARFIGAMGTVTEAGTTPGPNAPASFRGIPHYTVASEALRKLKPPRARSHPSVYEVPEIVLRKVEPPKKALPAPPINQELEHQ